MACGLPGTTWQEMFPGIPDLQALGCELKRRRLAAGMTLAKAGNIVYKSSTWVRDLEAWKPGHRCWPNCFFQYMLAMGFSEVEILLCMERFDLFPRTAATAGHFWNALSGIMRSAAEC